jgi:hypothetical protein
MLPDFSEIKKRLRKLQLARIKRAEAMLLSPFSEVPEHIVFEGDKLLLVREDGSIEQTEIREITVERQIDLTEVEKMSPETIRQRLDAVAQEMAFKKSKILFEDLEKTVRKTGNIVDVGGKPFSIDDFFKLLEKIWLEFDENDKPIMPMIVVGDKVSDEIAKVLRQAESDPECKKRFQEVIEKKRMEWRDREANRKLVG